MARRRRSRRQRIASWRYAVMIGIRVDPPVAGSPTRRACSRSSRPTRRASRRGRYATGSSSTSAFPSATTMRPSPTRRHRRRLSASCRGPRPDGHVHGVRHRQAVEALEHDREPEHPLELHDDRRLVAAHADDVTALDLALHVVALAGEQPLHRLVQVGLGRCRCSGAGHRHTVPQRGPPGIETAPGRCPAPCRWCCGSVRRPRPPLPSRSARRPWSPTRSTSRRSCGRG